MPGEFTQNRPAWVPLSLALCESHHKTNGEKVS